mmetsp:Transcript_15725/g.18179  ORF Transcript_15725/g.18179 Transcript_15725/m.18179 type:complete len:231 (-) Transcript_15725:1279-1971(-)
MADDEKQSESGVIKIDVTMQDLEPPEEEKHSGNVSDDDLKFEFNINIDDNDEQPAIDEFAPEEPLKEEAKETEKSKKKKSKKSKSFREDKLRSKEKKAKRKGSGSSQEKSSKDLNSGQEKQPKRKDSSGSQEKKKKSKKVKKMKSQKIKETLAPIIEEPSKEQNSESVQEPDQSNWRAENEIKIRIEDDENGDPCTIQITGTLPIEDTKDQNPDSNVQENDENLLIKIPF